MPLTSKSRQGQAPNPFPSVRPANSGSRITSKRHVPPACGTCTIPCLRSGKSLDWRHPTGKPVRKRCDDLQASGQTSKVRISPGATRKAPLEQRAACFPPSDAPTLVGRLANFGQEIQAELLSPCGRPCLRRQQQCSERGPVTRAMATNTTGEHVQFPEIRPEPPKSSLCLEPVHVRVSQIFEANQVAELLPSNPYQERQARRPAFLNTSNLRFYSLFAPKAPTMPLGVSKTPAASCPIGP